MSYAPIGTLYATAGLGRVGPAAYSPPFRRWGFRSFDGLGAVSGSAVTRNVSELQRLLRSKGCDPGRIDNTWGDRTETALHACLTRALKERPGDIRSQIQITDSRHVIRSPELWWQKIALLPDAQQETPSPAPSPAAEPSIVEDDAATEAIAKGTGPLMDILPWAIGGTVLLGVAGYFIYTGTQKRRAVAANRRRRRRRSTRRQRR